MFCPKCGKPTLSNKEENIPPAIDPITDQNKTGEIKHPKIESYTHRYSRPENGKSSFNPKAKLDKIKNVIPDKLSQDQIIEKLNEVKQKSRIPEIRKPEIKLPEPHATNHRTPATRKPSRLPLISGGLLLIGIIGILSGGRDSDSAPKKSRSSEVSVHEEVAQKATVPWSAKDCIGANYSDIEKQLKQAGFSNIDIRSEDDLKESDQDLLETVYSISIDGDDDFMKGEEFDLSADVALIYHNYIKIQSSIEIDCIGNWVQNNYDINVRIGDTIIGTISDMDDASFEFTDYPGEYKLVFENAADSSISGTTTLTCTDSTNIGLELLCNEDSIKVETVSLESQETGNPAEISEEETAALDLRKKIPLKLAKRAVTVAMTNGVSDDVFEDDGNTYDPEKFHTYRDDSDFHLFIEDAGDWSVKDKDSWHVENMRFSVQGYDIWFKVSCDVGEEDKCFVLSEVALISAFEKDLDSNDPSKIGEDIFELTTSNPFLIVHKRMIEKGCKISDDIVDAIYSKLGELPDDYFYFDDEEEEAVASEYERAYVRANNNYSIYYMFDADTMSVINFTSDDTSIMNGTYSGDLSSEVTIQWEEWAEQLIINNSNRATLIDGNGFDWDYENCDVSEAQAVLNRISS